MLVKEELILPEGFLIEPNQETHVRVGQVKTVTLNGREAVVQLVDGDRDKDGAFMEEPISAVVVVGSDEPDTTYAPSAAVYGRGDLVAVVLMDDGKRYIISPMDNYEHANRENYALIKGWALHDVLNGVLVDINDDLANSYLEFWDSNTTIITRIEGDPDKRHIMRRLLDYYKKFGQNPISYTHTEDLGWPRELTGGGPATFPQLKYAGKAYNARGVNGFDFAEWNFYAQADLTANLTAFHPTLTDLTEASCHPLAADTIGVVLQAITVVWFEDDPDYVLLIGSFPAWSTAPYLKFLEIPVASLSGRKKLEPDELNDNKIVLSWQTYAEFVRELLTIQRSYINWTAHAANVEDGERLYRALSVQVAKPNDGACTFGFIDGYGYDQGGVILFPNKLRMVEGTIVRSLRTEGVPAANGSMYEYDINYNDPNSSGIVDNWYSIHFHFYNDGAGTEYTDCTNNNPGKEYPSLTNGTNALTKRIDFDYHIDGHYSEEGGGGGQVSWSDGQDGTIADALGLLNQFWQRIYHNGALLHTDSFSYEVVSGPFKHTAQMVHHFIHFADLEIGLFVLERASAYFTNDLGPGYAADEGAYTQKELVVLFEGQEYVIWTVIRAEATFTTIYNFFPWIQDSNVPDAEETPPYDTTDDHNCVFYLPPALWTYMTPLSQYKASLGPYPSPRDDVCTLNWVAFFSSPEWHLPSDYMQVSIDRDSNSWSVRFPCPLRLFANMTLDYPNTGDTLLRLNGAAPTFIKPPAGNTITL